MLHIVPRCLATVTAAATFAIVLTSCSGTPDVEPVADALAEALSSGEFAELSLIGATPQQAATELADATERMGESTRSVVVDSIEEDDEGRTQVTLGVSWDLEHTDDDWSYATTAALELIEDTWHAEWTPALVHPELTSGDQLVLRRELAERADVLGADDAILVTERPVYRIGIDKTMVDTDGQPAAAEDLAAVLGIDAERFADRVEAAGDRAFVAAITLREDDADDVLADIDDIDGARALSDILPLAPTRDFARPLLGTVGEATAEIVEASEGRIQPGDIVGLSGLQRAYDDILDGMPGVRVEIAPADGDPITAFEVEPQPGSVVVTTLDPDLQIAAENVLSDVGPASAIVALEPSTGNVLAAASGSGGDGYSTATLGQYPPGSTFKVVSSLALLRASDTPGSTLPCSSTITVDGRQFGNYSDFPPGALGEISLRRAFAESCNTAFISRAETAPQGDLAAAAAALGLGVDHDLGVPAFLGAVPDKAEGTEHAASMIGQGRVLASPLAMAAVAASVADGRTVVPHVIDNPDDGPSDDEPSGSLTAEEADTLAELMRAAVEDGTASFLSDIPGAPVGAKTGTAEFGSDSPPDTHGWMIAFQADLAVAVFVESAESGSTTAGPLLEEFLRQVDAR